MPEDFAHGYQTLADDSLVLYQITAPYAPEASRGLRWNDPLLNISWPPSSERTISDQDMKYPLLES